MKTISFERVMLALIFIAVLYACYLLTGTSRKAFNVQDPMTTTSATTGSDSTGGKDTVPRIGQTIYVIDESATADCDCCPRQMKLYLSQQLPIQPVEAVVAPTLCMKYIVSTRNNV